MSDDDPCGGTTHRRLTQPQRDLRRRQLQARYGEVLKEPIPDTLQRLVDEIRKKERGDDGNPEAGS